jgi:hypothetical protein
MPKAVPADYQSKVTKPADFDAFWAGGGRGTSSVWKTQHFLAVSCYNRRDSALAYKITCFCPLPLLLLATLLLLSLAQPNGWA